MTIAEPKTPYHLSDRSDSDSEASVDRCLVLHGQETRNVRLEAALYNAGDLSRSSEEGGYSSNSSQSTPRSHSSREEFERKRKMHYDEFRISKYFRERGELCLSADNGTSRDEWIDGEEDQSPIESEPFSSESEGS